MQCNLCTLNCLYSSDSVFALLPLRSVVSECIAVMFSLDDISLNQFDSELFIYFSFWRSAFGRIPPLFILHSTNTADGDPDCGGRVL